MSLAIDELVEKFWRDSTHWRWGSREVTLFTTHNAALAATTLETVNDPSGNDQDAIIAFAIAATANRQVAISDGTNHYWYIQLNSGVQVAQNFWPVLLPVPTSSPWGVYNLTAFACDIYISILYTTYGL